MKNSCPLKWLSILLLSCCFAACQTFTESDFEGGAATLEDGAPAFEASVPAADGGELASPGEPAAQGGLGRFFRRGGSEEEESTPAMEPQEGPPPVAQLPVEAPAPGGNEAPDADLSQQGYLLRSGDPIIIILSGPTVDERVDATIDERGFIKLRHIGSVRAAGRTATELEREIEAEYTDRQQIYREIYATVHIPNRYYFIGGEVRQPGRYPLAGRVTLSQAIVAAGNFTEWARNDGRLTLLRNNERTTILFRDITNDPTLDVELRTGDVITVDRRGF